MRELEYKTLGTSIMKYNLFIESKPFSIKVLVVWDGENNGLFITLVLVLIRWIYNLRDLIGF